MPINVLPEHFGEDAVDKIINHFTSQLTSAGFDEGKAADDWVMLRDDLYARYITYSN